MIHYLLHASVLIAGSYLIYFVLIKNETFFKLNRLTLVGMILLSVGLPLISIPSNWSLIGNSLQVSETSNYVNPTTTVDPDDHASTYNDDISSNSESASTLPSDQGLEENATINKVIVWVTSNHIWWSLYLAGVLIFIVTFFVQLFIILAKSTILEHIQDGKYRIVELTKEQAPFSFWNTIFINPSLYDEVTYKQILDHEKIHIDQSHFIDKLIGELLVIAFWFNPFAWFSRSAITNNLEYLTDDRMLHNGIEPSTYQMSLLKVSVPQYPLYLTTNFNQSFLKNRITMMNSKKSSARSTWKYLFLLPFFGFSMLTLNAVHDIDVTAIEGKSIIKSTRDQQQKDYSNNHLDESSSKELLRELQKEMIQDGIISSKDESAVIKLLERTIVINNEEISDKLDKKYRKILRKYHIDSETNGIRIIAPITIVSGKMAGNYHQFDFDSEGSRNYDFHTYDVLEDELVEVDPLEDYLSDTNGLREYAELLKEKKTLITQAHKTYNNDNWQLISLNKSLLDYLASRAIDHIEDYMHFTIRDKCITVNGVKVIDDNRKEIENIFNKHEIPYVEGFRLLNKGQHIAILDPIPSLDYLKKDVLEFLKEQQLISSESDKILLEINGVDARLNSNKLSTNQQDQLYTILKPHQVTPSPGKVIQINRPSNTLIHVGYHKDNNYIGTMEFR